MAMHLWANGERGAADVYMRENDDQTTLRRTAPSETRSPTQSFIIMVFHTLRRQDYGYRFRVGYWTNRSHDDVEDDLVE